MALNSSIEIKNISKSFDGKIILDNLSITINKGELVALIGPSGTGKTTLLNIMANTITPDSGQVLINDTVSTDIKDRKDRAKKIGVIRQQFDLINELPVIHNVLVGRLNEWGHLKSILSLIIPQEKSVAENALNRVGIGEKIYEKTGNLSGGEQQRVALARLLVQKPEIILADEPVSSVDPARAEDILSLLVDLVKEENQTLIATLHSVDYVRKYFTRIIGMRYGRVLFDLPVESVKDEEISLLYDLKGLD